jgi:hypothetical protein
MMYVFNATMVKSGATLSAVPVRPGESLHKETTIITYAGDEALLPAAVVYGYPLQTRYIVGKSYAIQKAMNRPALCRRTLKAIRCVKSDNVFAVDLEAMAWPIEASFYDDPCDIVDAIQDAQQAFRNAFPGGVWLLEWAEENEQ